MSINYALLFLATLLLWFPRHWLRKGRKAARGLGLARRSRKREFERIRESGDNRVNFAEEFRKPRNFIDLFRAMVGGLILIGNQDWGIVSCFGLSDGVLTMTESTFLFEIQMAIIAIGVVRQVVRLEGRVTFYAPLFFFAGLAVSLCGFGAAFFGFLLVWTVNSALPIPPVGFLSVYTMMLWLMGLLFQGISNRYVYAAAILFILPVVVSLMARRSLALFTKKFR